MTTSTPHDYTPQPQQSSDFSTLLSNTDVFSAIDFSTLLPPHHVLAAVQSWIHDDVPHFDVGGLVVGLSIQTAHLYMKSPGVFAGKPFIDSIFNELRCTVKWMDIAVEGTYFQDASITQKIVLAEVTGPVHQILRGERTALNTIARCSAVATISYHMRLKIMDQHPDWKGTIAGTRKTTPGSFRLVEKYGLLVGGVDTHRMNMSQMTMLKDNHIWSVGSITKAVLLARIACGFTQKIEVECQNLPDALEACQAGADIIMLDNYTPLSLKDDAKEIKKLFPHTLVEASGGITIENICEYVSEDVDVISSGSLTQGYECVDFSLKIQKR